MVQNHSGYLAVLLEELDEGTKHRRCHRVSIQATGSGKDVQKVVVAGLLASSAVLVMISWHQWSISVALVASRQFSPTIDRCHVISEIT